MASLRPIPQPSVPMVDTISGRITQEWFLYFKSREQIGFANLSDVSTTAPANNQVPIFISATGKWTPGAN